MMNDFIFETWYKNKQKTVTERWEAVGFLDGIEDEEKKRKIAKEYERMARFLVSSDNDYSDRVCLIAFPVLRKVLMAGELISSYNPEFLCEEIKHELKFLAVKLSDNDYGIDLEAEATRIVSDRFRRYESVRLNEGDE